MKDHFFTGLTGNRLYVRRSGRNRKGQIVFIHGIALNGTSWRGLERQLTHDYECFSIDLRGHGESSGGRNATLDDLAGDCWRVIQGLELKNPIVIGHSLGGVITMNLLFNADLTTSPVVLISSPFKSPFAQADETPFLHSLRFKAGFVGAGAWYAWQFGLRHLSKHGIESADLWRTFRKVDPRVVWKLLNNLSQFDFTDRLDTIQNRVLLIYGQKDPLIPDRERFELAYRLRRSRIRVIPDTYHAPHFEKPKTIAEEIKRFLDEN